jgi:hypothetical protein
MEKKRGVDHEEELATAYLCAPTIAFHPSASFAVQYRTSS